MKQNRRDFLKLVTAFGAALSAGVLLSGFRDLFTFRERKGLVRLGSPDEIKKSPQHSPISDDLLLYKKGNGCAIYSRVCTHKGCLLSIKENHLQCPCHEGIFSHDGRVVSGKPTTDLPRYAIIKRNGILFADRGKTIPTDAEVFTL